MTTRISIYLEDLPSEKPNEIAVALRFDVKVGNDTDPVTAAQACALGLHRMWMESNLMQAAYSRGVTVLNETYEKVEAERLAKLEEQAGEALRGTT